MAKCEVKEKHLGQYVIMPTTIDVSFMKWWRSLVSSNVMILSFPHEQHGNAGRVSNSAKMETQKEFLDFVDLNTQPNGRSADSGPTMNLSLQQFKYQNPLYLIMRNVCQDQWLVNSTESNRRWGGGKSLMDPLTIGFKMFRPKVAICPHQEDYCDTAQKHG